MPAAAPPAHPPISGGLFMPPPRPLPGAGVPSPAVPPWARPVAAAPAKAAPAAKAPAAPAAPAAPTKEAAARGRRPPRPSPFRNPYAKKPAPPRRASPADPFDFDVVLDRLARDPSGGSAELGGRPAPRG